MNVRERKLAFLLLGLLLLIGGGALTYATFIVPIRERKERIKNVQEDVDKSMEVVEKVAKDKTRWEQARQFSLPADVDFAGSEYSKQIRKLLEAAGFPADSTSIAKTTTASAPTIATPGARATKPVLTRLSFRIDGRAELPALLKFLEEFYKLPLLHQVRTLKVERAPTSGISGQVKPGELIVMISLEAIVLDSAEDRGTLLPHLPVDLAKCGPNTRKLAEYLKANFTKSGFPGKEPPKELADLLSATGKESRETLGLSSKSLFSLLRALGIAQMSNEDEKRRALERALSSLGVKQVPLYGAVAEAPPRLASKRDYGSVASLNVFLGPPSERQQRRSDYDYTSQIILTDVTIEAPPPDDCTGWKASIYDRNRNKYFRIVQLKSGEYKVDESYVMKDGRRKKMYEDKLSLVDPDTNNVELEFEIVKLDYHDVILRRDGKYFDLHTGYSIKDMQQVPEELLGALGLEPAKQDKPAEGAKPPEAARPSSDAKPGERPSKPMGPRPTGPASPPVPTVPTGATGR